MLPRCKLNVAVCGAGVAALQPMYAYHHLLAPLVKFKLGVEQNGDGQAETQHT